MNVIFKVIVTFFPWQHYIVDLGLGEAQLGEGMELAGLPEGIPSQAEYLAEYCSATVSCILIVLIRLSSVCTFVQTNFLRGNLGNYQENFFLKFSRSHVVGD